MKGYGLRLLFLAALSHWDWFLFLLPWFHPSRGFRVFGSLSFFNSFYSSSLPLPRLPLHPCFTRVFSLLCSAKSLADYPPLSREWLHPPRTLSFAPGLHDPKLNAFQMREGRLQLAEIVYHLRSQCYVIYVFYYRIRMGEFIMCYWFKEGDSDSYWNFFVCWIMINMIIIILWLKGDDWFFNYLHNFDLH